MQEYLLSWSFNRHRWLHTQHDRANDSINVCSKFGVWVLWGIMIAVITLMFAAIIAS